MAGASGFLPLMIKPHETKALGQHATLAGRRGQHGLSLVDRHDETTDCTHEPLPHHLALCQLQRHHSQLWASQKKGLASRGGGPAEASRCVVFAASVRSWILREVFCRAQQVSHSNTRELPLPRIPSSGAKSSVLYCSVPYTLGQGQRSFHLAPPSPLCPKFFSHSSPSTWCPRIGPSHLQCHLIFQIKC